MSNGERRNTLTLQPYASGDPRPLATRRVGVIAGFSSAGAAPDAQRYVNSEWPHPAVNLRPAQLAASLLRHVAVTGLSRLGENARIRDRGELALSALTSSLGGAQQFAPTLEQVRETLTRAADLLRSRPYDPSGWSDGERFGLLAALANAGLETHRTAHVHAGRFLSVLAGFHVAKQAPRTRAEALKLLSDGDRVLNRRAPKSRGGWRISSAPLSGMAALVWGPALTPMPEALRARR